MKNIRNRSIKRKIMVLLLILMITIINMCPIISNAVETEDTATEENKDLVEIAFKDEVLYNAIAKELNTKIESKTDSTKTIKMTKENLESVTFIGVIGDKSEASDEVIDITGIEKFTNLTELILSSNQISDISALKDLTHLTELNLNDNQISDISPLKDLTNLTELNLGNNQISDISPLKDLTNLTKLSLGENQISDISALEGILGTAKISIIGQNLKAETIDNTHKVQLPIIFEQTKELILDKGYGQYEFKYIGCTLNNDGKSVTIEEGTNLATAWISNTSDENRITISYRFEIVDNYKPTSSEDKENTNGEKNTNGEEKKQDPTEATGKLPYAGKSIILITMLIITSIIAIILKIKKDKYNGIK